MRKWFVSLLLVSAVAKASTATAVVTPEQLQDMLAHSRLLDCEDSICYDAVTGDPVPVEPEYREVNGKVIYFQGVSYPDSLVKAAAPAIMNYYMSEVNPYQQ